MRSIVLQICIRGLTGERTVKRLRLSKALTVPETTTIIEACRRMAARRVDALLLTDSNALLCGILTDKVYWLEGHACTWKLVPVFYDSLNCLFSSHFLKVMKFSFFELKDIAMKVIAQDVNIEETPVSKVMTRNPVFVLSESLAVEALQKMVQGLFPLKHQDSMYDSCFRISFVAYYRFPQESLDIYQLLKRGRLLHY